MTDLLLIGAAYSVYTRIARLTLAAKGLAYRFEEIDIFAPGQPSAEHLARHPFGKIPVLEHGAFRLYETAAICRYLDEGFAGPPLQPADAAGRARVAQIVALLDGYAYRTLVWDIYVERVDKPREGQAPDEARIAAALPRAETALRALADLMGESPWLVGPAVTLADLHARPMLDYFVQAPEGAVLLARHPALAAWHARAQALPGA